MEKDSETIWNKEWAFKKQRSLPEIRPLRKFLGEGTVRDKFVQKDKYKFQEAKPVVHPVTFQPLPYDM